jgi:hypothetical protein
MSDGFERSLGDWMQEGRSSAPARVLESVTEHARKHPNQSRLRHLQGAARRAGSRPVFAGPEPLWKQHVVGLAAVAATATAVLVALPIVMIAPRPDPGEAPAVVPASVDAAASPAPVARVGFPVGSGLTGSVWLEQAEGHDDRYITLHPDGTIVEEARGPSWPVGIGLWQPTGAHTLTSVIVYPDADPEGHATGGLGVYRADWVLDQAAETGTLAWTATLQALDGSTLPAVTGDATLTRLHLAPLPPDAQYPLPTEHPWRPELGPMAQGPGSGDLSAVGDVAALSDCGPNNTDPPGYVVLHGDGTAFIASVAGAGPGLWVPSGVETTALSAWSSLPEAGWMDSWIGEARGKVVRTGSEEQFKSRFVLADRRLQPMAGVQLPTVDPTLWPELGSVWLQEIADGTLVTAYLTDGTLIARHPVYGTGTGYWQPIDAITRASSIFFATTQGRDHHLLSESTMADDMQTMTSRFELKERHLGKVDAGDATATRLDLEP